MMTRVFWAQPTDTTKKEKPEILIITFRYPGHDVYKKYYIISCDVWEILEQLLEITTRTSLEREKNVYSIVLVEQCILVRKLNELD